MTYSKFLYEHLPFRTEDNQKILKKDSQSGLRYLLLTSCHY